MLIPIRREGQTVSRMQEVAGGQEERVLAVDEFGNESWVPPDRLTGSGEAAVQQEALGVEVEPEPRTASENTTTANDNDSEAVDEEAVEILPQEPASFWSTMAGCCVVFFGLAWGVGQFIIGPAVWIGLVFSAPNSAPIASLLAVLIWWGGYWHYVRRVYYPGRPWVPVLDAEGQPRTREIDGQQFVYSQKECGLPKVFKKSWVPREAFPVAEEENDDDEHNDNSDSADQAA